MKGAGNFTARLFIDSKTHLPLMLSWTTPPNLVPVVRGTEAAGEHAARVGHVRNARSARCCGRHAEAEASSSSRRRSPRARRR